MFLIALSITSCATLGGLVAHHPWLIMLIAGFIGAASKIKVKAVEEYLT